MARIYNWKDELQVNQSSAFYNLNDDEQKELLRWIRENLKKTKTFNTWDSSYGLKHLFEMSANSFYVTNGTFKGAMLEAGFKVKDPYRINWHFNISKKSVRALYEQLNKKR
ncbi:MAG: hypothetical protein KUA32_03915 [Candidatus Desulforudis sp.]|nr:hypothetical protein [Desulforudis sp.]MBV1735684.1 hypothetical protein [Desulforudis sp.]